MGYKVDLFIEDGISGEGITREVDEEYLEGKTVKELMLDTLNSAKDQDKAGIIKAQYTRQGVGIYELRDTRPLEVPENDLAVRRIEEIDGIGEKRGRLHLIVKETEIIG